MANVIILDRDGNPVTWTGVTEIVLDTDTTGVQAKFQEGELETKTVAADFSTGNQIIPASSGHLITTATVEKPATLIPANIKNGVTVAGVVGTLIGGGGLLDGTETNAVIDVTSLRNNCFYQGTFLQTMSAPNLESIGRYAFYGCNQLTSINAPNTTVIDVYAFHGCGLRTAVFGELSDIGEYAFYNCTQLRSISSIQNLTRFNRYVFYYCAYLQLDDMDIEYAGPMAFYRVGLGADNAIEITGINNAVFESDCFGYAKISKLHGQIKYIGASAFSSNKNLLQINATINGCILNNAFNSSTDSMLDSVDFSSSNIQVLGQSSFVYAGRNRSDLTIPLIFDFRNSTLADIQGTTFNGTTNIKIYLPSTVTQFGSQCFANSSNIYVFVSGNDVIHAQTNSSYFIFRSSSNYKLFVPYDLVNTYKSHSDYSSLMANYIYGWLDVSGMEAEDVLPTYNKEGYQLTWYSDLSLTTTITTVPSGATEVYCAISASKVKEVVIVDIGFDISSVSIADSNNNPVDISEGFFFADTNDQFTITSVTYPSGNTLMCSIDGTAISAFPYSFTATSNITLKFDSYDSSVYNPDFATASWAEINAAATSGRARRYYYDAMLAGTYKDVTLSDNTATRVRIADLSGDKYELSNGNGYAKIVFEFTKLLKNGVFGQFYWNQSTESSLNNIRKAAVAMEDILPADLKSAIKEVSVGGIKQYQEASTEGLAEMVYNENKLFPPTLSEIVAPHSTASVSLLYSYPYFYELGAYVRCLEYYKYHYLVSDIQKDGPSSSKVLYWTRSACKGSNNYFAVINSNGAINMASQSSSSAYYSFLFCI